MQNVNSEKTNVIFGDDTINLWGKDVIIDTIGDVRFEISARSFYQVNPEQTEVLYKQALDYADLQEMNVSLMRIVELVRSLYS